MSDRISHSRRRFLATTGAALASSTLAGCSALPGGTEKQPAGDLSLADFRGSGPMVSSRPAPGGPTIEELPDLSGELTLYMGGGEGGGLYQHLVQLLERAYPDFTANVFPKPSAALANQIVQEMEGGGSPADVFWAIDAGALGYVANAGYTTTLPEDVVDIVPKDFHPNDQWVGVAGRARSIPYNTDKLSASDVPKHVGTLTKGDGVPGRMGWAPTYPAFQAFVTAMRVLRGEKGTKDWLNGMQAQNVSRYRDEWYVSNAVADGEIAAGFANHYYAIRVMAQRDDPPIDLAFTSNDAGSLVNASGAEIIKGTKQKTLAANFIKHLLSAEAQEYFATRTFAYPMIPQVEPVGGLPTIDKLNPPELSLTKLSDLEPTVELLRETGVL